MDSQDGQEGGEGGAHSTPLACLHYFRQKLIIERTQIVIVNSTISVAVVLTPILRSIRYSVEYSI